MFFVKLTADKVERHYGIRIEYCFHRFHLLCVYRDWFMTRHVDKDEFGGDVIFEVPEVKRCPVCMSVAG